MPSKHPIEMVEGFIKEASEFAPDAAARYQEYRGRRGAELETWHKWNETGDEAHLGQLLTSVQPLIRKETNKRMKGLGGSIPRAAIENELRTSALKSIKTYDPEKAALSTHITRGFQRVTGFIGKNRNAKSIPSDDIKKYQRFQNASLELHDELGRPPTAEELSDRLPWNVKTIQKLQVSFGPEVHTDMGDGVSSDDNYARLHPHDAFQLVRSQLTPQEETFGHMFFVPEGEKQPAIKNIAKALNIPQHQAYRLKANVETRVGSVLKRQ